MPPPDANITTCRLRILATSDLHAHLAPYDYFADKPSDRVGLSRTASLIADWRSTAVNSLLLDNGDLIQGTPLGDRATEAEAPHPMIEAMNALNYDVATLGNHEFNYGIPFLTDVMAQADFPFTVANITSLADTPLTAPFVILDRTIIDDAGQPQTLKIGVVGFAPPQIMTWDQSRVEGKIIVEDIFRTAQRIVPIMKQNGADIVIALCHSGISDLPHTDGMENAAAHLATVPDLDAIITGHSHLIFPGPKFASTKGADIKTGTLNGIPAVMPGLWGSHLGVIDLILEKTRTGWRRKSHEVALPSIFAAADAPEIADITERAHQDTLRYVRDIVGETTAPLHSYFSLIEPDATVGLVAEAQRAHLQTVLAGSQYQDLPILAAAAPFKAGGRGGPNYYTDIPKGPIAIKDIASLYLYPNVFYGVLASGAEVREWLERAASMYNQVPQGTVDAPLLDPDFPTYNFDTLFGLTYDIDITVPSRFGHTGALINPKSHRITNLMYRGTPVTDQTQFAVATNNYRAVGGGNFPLSLAEPPIYAGSEACRDIVAAHLTRSPTFSPTTAPVWRFTDLTGTTVVFDTGVGALKYLDDTQNGRISDTGHRENGFARLRLTL